MNSSIKFNDIEWSQLNEFARQKSKAFGAKAVRLLELNPGFHDTEWCMRGHSGYVIEGELQIEFKERTETFAKGDGIFIKYGDEHKAVKTKEKVLLFLVDED